MSLCSFLKFQFFLFQLLYIILKLNHRLQHCLAKVDFFYQTFFSFHKLPQLSSKKSHLIPFRDIFIIPIWYIIVKDIFKKRSKNALKGTQGKKKDISAQARDGSRHEPEQHIALRERNQTGGLRHTHKARGLFRRFDRLPARADGQPENE